MSISLRHINQSLSLKLSFSILLLAILIFVASLGILFVKSRRNIKEEAIEQATSVLNVTAQRVLRYLNTVETATNANDWLVTETLQPDSLLSYSRRIVSINSHLNGCSITTEPNTFPQYGRYFSAYSVREGDSIITVREGEYEYFDKVWYKTPKQQGKPCWVDPFDDYNEGTLSQSEMIASYCKPLYAADGHFVGVISSDLSLRRLSDIINTEKPYPNAYFMMIGEDGHYFVHPDTTKLFTQTIFSGTDVRQHADIIALGHEMTSGNRGHMEVYFDGVPCLVCYQPILGTGWSLALVSPRDDILRGYSHLTYLITPLLVIGLILILLLCHTIVTHAIRPLSRLLTQSQRITEGNYDDQIPHTARPDVVGRLQNSFATMQESLNRHLHDIQQMNSHTELRNNELLQANLLVEEADRQKTAFIQNMTHQIRTPLNIIMGFSQILHDDKSLLPEEMASITSIMNHNSMSLNRMVLMLYDSSDTGLAEELQGQRDELVSCNEVARESIDNTHQHFPDLQINFETTLPDTFTIRTSRLYLMRSLREILYNSAKYSDGQHVSVRVTRTDDIVRFTFEDTGAGISEDYQLLMFKPFTKVDDLSEGLGLGLPLAKRHITNLGGSLNLDTSYHAGCRFIVELPIHQE